MKPNRVQVKPIFGIMLLVTLSACGQQTIDMLNLPALRYQQRVDWCYNGTNITSVSHIKTQRSILLNRLIVHTVRGNGTYSGTAGY